MRRACALVLGAAALTLTACGTTYDAEIASDESVAAEPATTTTLPTGSAEELLPKLAEEAAQLSTLMIEDGDAAAAAARIGQYWEAVKAEVNANRPELLSDFSLNVGRCATAVQYKRSADADKASKNLDALVASYLAS